MFEQATLLVVGYRLNRDETRVISIRITRPSVGRPEWYIDLELPEGLENIVQMPHGSETATPPSAWLYEESNRRGWVTNEL